MNWLKEVWNATWIEIKIDKKFLLCLLIAYGLFWLRDYYWTQGAIEGIKYGLQQQAQEKSDENTGNVGTLNHNEDNPKI